VVSCEPASQQRLSAASIKRYSADEAWKYATTPPPVVVWRCPRPSGLVAGRIVRVIL